MKWITASESVDHALAAAGVPDEARMRIMATVMTALSQEARRQEREVRHGEVLKAVAACAYNVHTAAERLGVTPQAVYYHVRQEEKVT